MDPEIAAAPGGAVLLAAGGFSARVGASVVPVRCGGFPPGVRAGARVVAMEPVEHTRSARQLTTRRLPAAIRLTGPTARLPLPPCAGRGPRPLERPPLPRRVGRDGRGRRAGPRVDTGPATGAAGETGRRERARAATPASGARRGVGAVHARAVPRRGAVPLAAPGALGPPGPVLIEAGVRASRLDKPFRVGAP